MITSRGKARSAFVFLTTVVVGFGCSTGNDAAPGREDSGTSTGALAPREPRSVFDAGVPSTGTYCAFLVAAECDGNEDCGPGQTCCGMLDGGALRYNSIKCQDTCDSAAGGIPLCHAGEPCATPGGTAAPDGSGNVCRRSLVLPPYLAVCQAPNPLLPNDLVGKPAAAHAVNCGASLTCGEGTKCCVLGSWDAATKATSIRTGYCAPLTDECDCSKAPAADAG